MDEAQKARQIDLLTYQIGELEEAQLRPGEQEELAERRVIEIRCALGDGLADRGIALMDGLADGDRLHEPRARRGGQGLLQRAARALRPVAGSKAEDAGAEYICGIAVEELLKDEGGRSSACAPARTRSPPRWSCSPRA